MDKNEKLILFKCLRKIIPQGEITLCVELNQLIGKLEEVKKEKEDVF